jgi:hypothetical protein
MRWSEPLTIYLAAGASFGVSRYLCAERNQTRLRALFEGTAAALLWPLAGVAILFNRLRHAEGRNASENAIEARAASRVEDARHAFMRSVVEMLERVRLARYLKRDEMERTLYALREGAEQYVSLAGVEPYVCPDSEPAAHELELARLSGRRGQDLFVAGRCAHRRNVSRIRARYERERARLLRKLRELRMEDENLPPVYREDAGWAELRELAEARLEIYSRATDLFSLLEDEGAARSAARLLDEECADLRRLQRESVEAACVNDLRGEEKCIEQPPQLICKDHPRETTFTQG